MLDWQNAGSHELHLQVVLNLIFRKHSKLLEFLFEINKPRLCAEPRILLAESGGFSSGEQLLIRIALDIWDGSGNARISDIIKSLDDENFRNVLASIWNLRSFEERGEHFVWRQLKLDGSSEQHFLKSESSST